MEKQKAKEIVSILMESSLYFSFSVNERLEIIKKLTGKVDLCEQKSLFK
ncbi:MAG: hypothetical protein HY099_01155 [Nitrospirae bacterium]|nr:hypothetical protein [Nitrospirota bacterium]